MNAANSLLTGKTSDFLKIGVASAGRGDLNAVRQLLELRPQWVTQIGSHGRTMMWEAAYRGKTQMVDYLIRRGADVNACACHFTPLQVDISAYCAALVKKHEDTANLLLEQDAEIDFYTEIYLGNYDAVLQYLDEDPSLATAPKVQHDTNINATALHYAVASSHKDILGLLLSRGADPSPYGFWLARFAIWREREDILQKLFDSGLDPADVELPRSGVTNEKVRNLLEKYGVGGDPNQQEGGWPPLVFQCRGDRGGNLERVRGILAQGADVNVRNYKGQTALHCAAKAGFVEIGRELLAHGANVDSLDKDDETPLFYTLRSTIKNTENLTEMARLLLDHGANTQIANRKGQTPESVAKRKRNSSVWLRMFDEYS